MLSKFDGSTKNFRGTTSLEWIGVCRDKAVSDRKTLTQTTAVQGDMVLIVYLRENDRLLQAKTVLLSISMKITFTTSPYRMTVDCGLWIQFFSERPSGTDAVREGYGWKSTSTFELIARAVRHRLFIPAP